MAVKDNICKILFYIIWTVFLVYNILDNTAWVALSEGFTFTRIFMVIRYILGALCLVIIILNLTDRKYTGYSLAAYILLGAVTALSAYYSKNYTYFWYFLIFAAAYRQDAGKVLRITAAVTAAMLVIIVGASLTHLAVDHIFDAADRHRHGLGFGWTTTGPVLYLFFILQYIYIRREKMKIYEYLILEAAAVFFFIMTDTNLAFCSSTAILIFMFVEGLIKNRWKFWKKLKWLWILIPLIICLVTIAVYFIYDREGHMWSQLNSAMHGRLTLGQNAIREYGITLFGQPVSWRGFFIYATEVADYNYVDCSYIQLLIQFGALFLAAVIAIYTLGMYKAVSKGDYHLVWIYVLILLFSVMEPRLMNMTFNVFPMIVFMSLPTAFQQED